ncbi:glycosyltransferase [Blastococcus mobilis]|uniref:Glycosyltransferase, GT2 family n=1 Tax=Blastococcus mobilis TaxID=1938746 RepID=A0A238Z1Y3_9ACTN|nr:glycosyltransferase [Blastococcus mobilis]SNR77272.1 Glycosyltransferase, GT2 family [Blastococcus mobilis]
MTPSGARFSIVVPTYQRRDVLLGTMTALARLETPWPIELVVVVDGSTDGTADAARAVPLPFPLTVVEQPNRGAAAARNAGAASATGEFLLFLDDDMVADPRLLVEHDAVLRQGADAAVGHIPLHPDSPRTLLTPGVERWVRLRHERLTRTQGQLALGDLLTGQLSVRAAVFQAAGGFDESFNVNGAFGAEDTDFLHRLLSSGAVVRYAPGAITSQRYVVTPDQYLRQWRQGGRADAALVRKHPALADTLAEQHGAKTPTGRLLARWAPSVPSRVARALAAPVVARARTGGSDLLTRWAFARVRDAQYWRGLAEGGGLRTGAAVLLAYHAVEDVDDAVIGDWCVGPELFERQLDALTAAGVSWIGLGDLLAWLDGAPLPDRAVLLTFDDGYADLLQHAAPALERRGIPAVVLLVSDQIGGWNEWDARRGAGKLPLLTEEQLHELVARGWSLGAHSHTHAHLTQLDDATLGRELTEPLAGLRARGLPVEPVLAYPHGEHDARVRAATRRAGYAAAFALEGRRPSTGARGRFALPRIEVRRDTTPEALVDAVRHPPRHPAREVERELRGVARRLLRTVGSLRR